MNSEEFSKFPEIAIKSTTYGEFPVMTVGGGDVPYCTEGAVSILESPSPPSFSTSPSSETLKELNVMP